MLDLGEKQVSAEIKELVNDVQKAKEEIDVYCQLVMQLFLRQSLNN